MGDSPDPRPFGGAEGMVLTDAREMAFVVAMGWDGAVDMQVNIDKPQLAKILREIADKTEASADSPFCAGRSDLAHVRTAMRRDTARWTCPFCGEEVDA